MKQFLSIAAVFLFVCLGTTTTEAQTIKKALGREMIDKAYDCNLVIVLCNEKGEEQKVIDLNSEKQQVLLKDFDPNEIANYTKFQLTTIISNSLNFCTTESNLEGTRYLKKSGKSVILVSEKTKERAFEKTKNESGFEVLKNTSLYTSFNFQVTASGKDTGLIILEKTMAGYKYIRLFVVD